MADGVLVGVGAPHGLVLVDHELGGDLLLVDEVDGDLGLAVREGAELLVLALGQVARVLLAELALVAAGVVQLLDLVVGLRAAVPQRARLVVLAEHVLVVDVGPPPILLIVVEQTDFQVVRVCVTRGVHS